MSGRKIGEIVRGLRGDLRSLITSVERHANEEWGTLEDTKDIESLLHSASRLCEGLTLVDEATQTRFRSELAQLSGRLSHIQKFEDEMKNLGRVSARATKRLQDTSRSDLHTVRDELQEMYSKLNDCLNNAQIHFSQAQEATRNIKLKLTELTLWRDSEKTSQKKNQSIEQIQASLLKEAELAELAGRLKNANISRDNIAGDFMDWLQSQTLVEQLQNEFLAAERNFKDGNSNALLANLINIEGSLEALRAEIAQNKELKSQMAVTKDAIVDTLKNLGYATPKTLVKTGNNLSEIRIVADPPNLGPSTENVGDMKRKLKRRFEGMIQLNGKFTFEIFGVEKHEGKLCKDFIDGMQQSSTLQNNDLELTMIHRGILENKEKPTFSKLWIGGENPETENPEVESQS